MTFVNWIMTSTTIDIACGVLIIALIWKIIKTNKRILKNEKNIENLNKKYENLRIDYFALRDDINLTMRNPLAAKRRLKNRT